MGTLALPPVLFADGLSEKKDIFRFAFGGIPLQVRLMSVWEINLQIPAEPAWILINRVNESKKEQRLVM